MELYEAAGLATAGVQQVLVHVRISQILRKVSRQIAPVSVAPAGRRPISFDAVECYTKWHGID